MPQPLGNGSLVSGGAQWVVFLCDCCAGDLGLGVPILGQEVAEGMA